MSHIGGTAIVRGLQTVFKSVDVVQLKCAQCSESIRSSWYFRHPVTQQVHVLLPAKGHYACRKRLGRRCPWIPLSDLPGKNDDFHLLEFCPHKREKRFCKVCGGSCICQHQKRRDQCPLCKGLRRAQDDFGEKWCVDSLGRFPKLKGWVDSRFLDLFQH